MKLDINALRYLSREDFRVLTAVEMGQKNHEIVPVDLITAIAGLKHGGTFRHLSVLLRYKLLHHDRNKYDGYRLTYMGYDFLAIRTLLARRQISAVGRRIGVGKEADVFEVRNEDGEVLALKLHRLGRTSFRAVKNKRDYLKDRSSASFSWLYLSRLAALKEFAFMAALEQRGMPVPKAIDHNRHAVLMSLVDAIPLTQVRELVNPGVVYTKLMDFMSRLARFGLIHCDFNEFNVLVDDDDQVTIIDFPQMVSVAHPNAEELFDRDAEGIVRYFTRKLGYVPEHDESLTELRPNFAAIMAEASAEKGLDVDLAASGFKHHHEKALEQWRLEAAAAAQEASGGTEEASDNNDSGSSSSSIQENSNIDGQSPSDGKGHQIDARYADSRSNEPGPTSAAASSPTQDPLSRTPGSGTSDLKAACIRVAPHSSAEGETSSESGRSNASDECHSDTSGAECSDGERDRAPRNVGSRHYAAASVADTSRSSRRPPVQSTPKDVQQRVTAIRQGKARRGVMANASRNAQKRNSRTHRSALDASMRMG